MVTQVDSEQALEEGLVANLNALAGQVGPVGVAAVDSTMEDKSVTLA